MRDIAIVGAGETGIHLAFLLLAEGYRPTLYSDQSTADIRDGRIPSTANFFQGAQDLQKSLGINFWDGVAPDAGGVSLDFRDASGGRVFTVRGALKGQAVDQRTKFSRWLEAFEERGGRLIVRPTGLDELERVAAQHELTLVASGKRTITGLFQRDEGRSVHRRPPRQLGGALLAGPAIAREDRWPDASNRAVDFTVVEGAGEIFFIPFYTHTHGECLAMLCEAFADGPMDVFRGVQDAEGMKEALLQLFRTYMPDLLRRFAGCHLTDAGAWLKGAFTPEVRFPVATLPSGRIVMGVGDAVILNDPIAAQGGNGGIRMARAVAEDIVRQGDRPFDRQWMEASFERFWNASGRDATRFTNVLLDPPPTVVNMLRAASSDPALAHGFMRNFDDPPRFFPWIEAVEHAGLLAGQAGAGNDMAAA